MSDKIDKLLGYEVEDKDKIVGHGVDLVHHFELGVVPNLFFLLKNTYQIYKKSFLQILVFGLFGIRYLRRFFL